MQSVPLEDFPNGATEKSPIKSPCEAPGGRGDGQGAISSKTGVFESCSPSGSRPIAADRHAARSFTAARRRSRVFRRGRRRPIELTQTTARSTISRRIRCWVLLGCPPQSSPKTTSGAFKRYALALSAAASGLPWPARRPQARMAASPASLRCLPRRRWLVAAIRHRTCIVLEPAR